MTEVPKAMGGRDCDPCDGLEVSSLELLHNQKSVLMLRLQTLLDHVETVQTMSRVKYDATAFTLCQRMDAQLDLLQVCVCVCVCVCVYVRARVRVCSHVLV